MSKPFDIFRLHRAGVRWLESAESLDHRKSSIHELAVGSPGEFLLLDHKTGNREVIKPNQAHGR
jgi:hypothetical protein